MEKDLDLICIGRSCVDLYSDEFGVPLERAMRFVKSLGGCPMNTAIGASRLGLKVGAITAVGKEDNGRYLMWQLECEGVDTSNIKVDPGRLTAMVLLSIRGHEDFPLIQYRENCADMGLAPEDISPAYLARAKAVLVSGVHLSKEGVRKTTHEALRLATENGSRRIFDIDYRPNLWGLQGHDAGSSRWAQAAEHITRIHQEILPHADLIVGTEEEFRIIGGHPEAIESLRAVRQLSKALLVLKQGDRGCLAFPGPLPDTLTDEFLYPGFPVKVYNSIGAGDGFISGFLRGWLRNEDLATCCRYANAAGAFAVSRLGCSSAYPSWDEMQYFLTHGSREKWLRNDVKLEQIHWSTTRRRAWHDLAILAFDQAPTEAADAAPEDAAFFRTLTNIAEEDKALAQRLGLMADDTHSPNLFLQSNAHPFWVGRSIALNKAQGDIGSILKQWPENHVVTCLLPARMEDGAEEQALRLFSACRSTGHELLLELPGRDADLLHQMNRCYELGIYPDYWALLPASDTTWVEIEQLISRYDPYCRGLLLAGRMLSESELLAYFADMKQSSRRLGFIVGRDISCKPVRESMAGTIDGDTCAHTLGGIIKRLAAAW